MADEWVAGLPHYEQFRLPSGSVDWQAWLRAVNAAAEEIARREGEDKAAPSGG